MLAYQNHKLFFLKNQFNTVKNNLKNMLYHEKKNPLIAWIVIHKYIYMVGIRQNRETFASLVSCLPVNPSLSFFDRIPLTPH